MVCVLSIFNVSTLLISLQCLHNNKDILFYSFMFFFVPGFDLAPSLKQNPAPLNLR